MKLKSTFDLSKVFSNFIFIFLYRKSFLSFGLYFLGISTVE